MSQTLRDIISEIATDAKALTLDDKISFRYLLSKFLGKLEYFLRLEARSREFSKTQNLWKPVGDHVKFIDVPVGSCSFIDRCNNLKRSEIKIPEALNTNYGLLIKVLTVDRRYEYKFISSETFRDYATREYGSNLVRACYLENGYIYIPNTTVEKLLVLIIPKDLCSIDKLNGVIGDCATPLDCIVTYPDYLVTLAKQEVLKELFGGYKHEVQDEKSNDNSNIKN